MPQPFHLAFVVDNLEHTRSFYGELLQCREGRSTETWVDFDFFGHQLSCHLGTPNSDAVCQSGVDGVAVPLPHFGCVLTLEEFDALAERLQQAGTAWVLEPQRRFVGEDAEQATMFLRDPSGNALEFKAFQHADALFQ